MRRSRSSPKAVEQGNPWYFQTSTTSDLIADALARTIHKMPNNKTIAMLAPNDDYGRATIGSLKDALGRLGGPQVVFDDYYEATQNDFSAILLKMRSTNPDSLYIDVRYPAAVTVLTQMAEFGIKKPVFGGVNFYNPKLIEQAGKLLEGVQIYVNWAPEFTDPASEEFKKQYQRLQKDVPDSNASLGWTAGMVMANALKSAGRNADAEAIRAALAKTDWMSPQGPIKFDAKGASNAPAHVLQFKDGRWNVVN
jgi:branched-chain amino acid transport system substrate-binding protein